MTWMHTQDAHMLGPLFRDMVVFVSGMSGALQTWPVESDAPLRRARMSPERCSILTTLTGISSLLTYCSSGRFRKSKPRRNTSEGQEKRKHGGGKRMEEVGRGKRQEGAVDCGKQLGALTVLPARSNKLTLLARESQRSKG